MVKTVTRKDPKIKLSKSEIVGCGVVILGSAIAALTNYQTIGGFVIGIGAYIVISGAYNAVKKL
ncbi:MAG: hypothetical protein IKQ31_03980 [Clostridia bacterium]|nr:hypothetical protein [Clostridia bacterium]